MRIDVDAVRRAVNELQAIHAGLRAGSGLTNVGGLGSFTAAAGYRDTGRRLGRISGHYSPESLGVLADHVMDAAVTTEVNLNNALLADGTLARALHSIQAPTGAGATFGAGYGSPFGYLGATESFQPNRRAKNSRASDFTPPTPAVSYDPALLALNNKLATTNFAAPAAEAAYWEAVAAKVTAAVQELFGPKQSLATSLETDWVRMGDQRISRIQRAGAVFAGNAHQMAVHATALGNAIGSEAVLAAAASATYASIVQPAARKTFEQTYLVAYPPRATAGLAATVPTFTKLLPDLDRISGDSFSINELSRPAAPSFERSPLPQVVREAFAANGYGELAHAATPIEVISEYGQPNPDVLEAIAAGATPTQAAAAAAPSMPPTLSPGTAPASASGMHVGVPGAAATHGRVASALGSLGSAAMLGIPAGGVSRVGVRGGAASAPAAPAALADSTRTPVSAAAGGAPVGGGRHRAANQTAPVVRTAAGAAPAGVGGERLAGDGGATQRRAASQYGAAASEAAPQRGAAGRQAGALGAERPVGPGASTGAAGAAGRAGNPGATRAMQASAGEMGGAGLAGAPGMAGRKSHGGAPGAGAAGGAGAGGMSRALGAGSSAGVAGVAGSGLAAGVPAAGSAGMPLAAPGLAAGAGAGTGALRGGAGALSAGAAGHNASGSAGPAGAAGQGRPMVGGAPMGGAAGRGGQKQGNKGSKVKTVTSAAEREGNLRALLGDAPLVLPPVIGDEVRR